MHGQLIRALAGGGGACVKLTFCETPGFCAKCYYRIGSLPARAIDEVGDGVLVVVVVLSDLISYTRFHNGRENKVVSKYGSKGTWRREGELGQSLAFRGCSALLV